MYTSKCFKGLRLKFKKDGGISKMIDCTTNIFNSLRFKFKKDGGISKMLA